MFSKGQRVIIKSGQFVGKIGTIAEAYEDRIVNNIYGVTFDGSMEILFVEGNVEHYFDKKLQDIIDE